MRRCLLPYKSAAVQFAGLLTSTPCLLSMQRLVHGKWPQLKASSAVSARRDPLIWSAACRFNFDEMLDLKGNTAVYLLYAYARIQSIIAKVGKDPQQLAHSTQLALEDPSEVSALLAAAWHACDCFKRCFAPRKHTSNLTRRLPTHTWCRTDLTCICRQRMQCLSVLPLSSTCKQCTVLRVVVGLTA